MFDTHFHLSSETQFADIYKPAMELGVNYFLLAGTNFDDSKDYLVIAEKYKNVYTSIGVHPHDAKNYINYDLKPFEDLAKSSAKVLAIGEVGLDYYYGEELEKKDQKIIFQKFIDLAIQLDLPLVLHCRDAYQDCWDILKEFSSAKIIFHCYTGSLEWLKKFLDIGAYFSFGGILTFKNAHNVRDLFHAVPDDRFFAETDSPYLAPTPFRGKTNQPAYIIETIKNMAKLRAWDFDKAVQVTTKNAKTFFELN